MVVIRFDEFTERPARATDAAHTCQNTHRSLHVRLRAFSEGRAQALVLEDQWEFHRTTTSAWP